MNKSFKNLLVLIATISLLLVTYTSSLFASESGTITASVPAWGGWSSFSSETVKKDSSTASGEMYLNTSPYLLQIYGQLYKSSATSPEKEKALQNDISLALSSWKKASYYSSQSDGTNYKGAIKSNNMEPDSRKVTYKFRP